MKAVERISYYATLLGLTEIGLGGFLHSLKIPFTGTFLCANQIFILSRASLDGSHRLETSTISLIAALLKTLSPTGKKITPMIALFLQGALFNAALILFGDNGCGRIVGGIFAMLSSILQPLFFYYLLYGHLFFDTLIAGSQEMSTRFNLSENSLIAAFALFTGIKLTLGIFAAYAASRAPEEAIGRYLKKVTRPFQSSSAFGKTPIKGALSDLFKPFFLFSILATGFFLFWKERELATVLQHVLQTFAIAFLCFYCLRSLPLNRLLDILDQKKGSLFFDAWKKTLNAIQLSRQRLPHESLPSGDGSHSGQT
jgi:hypothetical protein